jgi:hypothetical protein
MSVGRGRQTRLRLYRYDIEREFVCAEDRLLTLGEEPGTHAALAQALNDARTAAAELSAPP